MENWNWLAKDKKEEKYQIKVIVRFQKYDVAPTWYLTAMHVGLWTRYNPANARHPSLM